MDKNYKNLIWTNHALERMKQRGISQGDAWATWNRADQTRKGRDKGVWVYYKTYPSVSSGRAQKIEVVAKQNQKKEWLILSVWSRPDFETGGRRSDGKKSLGRLFLDSLLGRK